MIVIRRKYLLLLFFICFAFILPASSKIYFLEADYYQDKIREKKITIGKGEIISSDKSIVRVAISGPSVADVQVLNDKQIFLRAKNLGITTFLAWEKNESIPTRFDILVLPDVESLSKQLHELDENINVEYVPPASALTQEDSQSGGSEEGEMLPAGGETSLSPLPQTSASSSDNSSNPSVGRIILSGEVKNAEIIARALQVAGAYIGDQGIRIISQPGGQVVNGLAGDYDIHSNSSAGDQGSSQQGSAVSFGVRDAISFTSNKFANLSRGVIATTQNGLVVSFLAVKDPPQISVAIRFYEINRNLARNLGLNTTIGGHTLQGGSFVGGNGISMLIGGIASIAKLNSFMGGAEPEFSFGSFGSAGGSFVGQSIGDGVTGAIFYPKNGVGVLLQALQERGEIKSLAEPTLVISNGEPASFLAGGEVPIVRSVFTAGGASQDITYEPFGIKFTILPIVTKEDRIHLQLVPEIRDIDTELSNFVVPPGSTSVRPPAFKTRRTQTQVELEHGQAFAISGLMREDNTRNLRKVPGVGDIPIVGGLFRSKSFKKGETELLIVVSPEIVRPTKPEKIAKLSIPEVPYKEFNQVPPMKPDLRIYSHDEVGPDMKEPLDPNKYNEKPSINNEQKKAFINVPPVSHHMPASAINLRRAYRVDVSQYERALHKDKKVCWLD